MIPINEPYADGEFPAGQRDLGRVCEREWGSVAAALPSPPAPQPRALGAGGVSRRLRLPTAPLAPDLDATYRPMYPGDVPLDPLEHLDVDGEYPIDLPYSDGLRPPYPTSDHMLA